MKRQMLFLLIVVLTAIIGLMVPGQALSGDVDVNIGIGVGVPLPRVIVSSPPAVFLVPDTYVYYAPEVAVQLFFYSGSWYTLNDGYWFRSADYSGPWVYLPPSRVPVVFLHLPPRYYEIPRGQKLIPYGQLKKHWKEWEEPRYKEVRDWEKSYHNQWRTQDEDWKKWKGGKPVRGGNKK
jgi:hypothetical protein